MDGLLRPNVDTAQKPVCVTYVTDLTSNHLAEVGEALKPGICGVLAQSEMSSMWDQGYNWRGSVHNGSAGLLVKKLNFFWGGWGGCDSRA